MSAGEIQLTELLSGSNSINEHYFGDAQFRYIGHKQLAASYIPFARRLLGTLRNDLSLGGINSGIRQLKLRDGAYVRVSYNGTTHSIFVDVREVVISGNDVWVVFVESGYLDLRPYRGLFLAPDPAYQYYVPELLAAYAKGATTVPYQAPDDAAWLDWLKVYLINNQGRIDITKIRNDITAYTPGCESESVLRGELDKRLLFYVGDACAASGKFKLYFQSHIGKMGDLYAPVTMFMLSQTSTVFSTFGLYTANNGAYYIVEITPSLLTMYPTYRSRLAEFLSIWLRDADDDKVSIDFETRTKIEAYILAETYFYTDLESYNPNILYGKVYHYGSSIDTYDMALWYGWKGNWKGSKWDIVTHQGILNSGGTAYKWRVARHWQVALSETKDIITKEVTFSATLTKVEEDNWTPHKGREIIWVPYRDEDGVMDMTFIDWYEDATDLADKDVPVYCWYDSNDRLVTIRHKRTTRPDQTFVSLNNSGKLYSDYVIAPNSLHDESVGYTNCQQSGFYVKLAELPQDYETLFKSSIEEETFLDLQYTGGQAEFLDFYIADSSYFEGCVSYYGAFNMWAYEDGSSQGWGCGPSYIDPITPWEQDTCAEGPYSDLRYVYQMYYDYRLEFNSSSAHTVELASVLCIPHYSSEAVYLGKKQYRFGLSDFFIDRSPVYSVENLIGGKAHGATGFGVVIYCGIRHPLSYGAKNWNYWNIKVGLVTKHDSKVLLDEEEITSLPLEWSHIWTVSSQNPILGASLQVINGMTGEYYYNGDDRLADDHPNYEKSTTTQLVVPSQFLGYFVGWS